MTTISATRTDMRTERGTAVPRGIKSTKRGTAIRDSPKPSVERTRVAMKLIRIIAVSVKSDLFEVGKITLGSSY